MRVTNKQLLNLVTRNVSISSNQLLKAQERLATQKVINRPSDDPIGMSRVLEYRKKLGSIDQYIQNIGSSKIRVQMTDSNLDTLHDLMGTARTIAFSHASGDEASVRNTALNQIENIYAQARDIANTRLGGAYLFGGHSTDTLPFPQDEVTTSAESSLSGGEYFKVSSPSTDYYVWYNIDGGSSDPAVAGRTGIAVHIATGDTAEQVAQKTQAAIDAVADLTAAVSDAAVTIKSDTKGVEAADGNTLFSFANATYNGDSGTLNTILGEGVALKINAHGNEIFTGVGVTDGVNIFSVLKDLRDELEGAVVHESVVQNLGDQLGQAIAQVEKVMSQQYTALKRLDQTEEYWNQFRLRYENLLSDTEDADTAQVAMELKIQETTYEMALSAASNVLKRNLMDFLR